ncbi:cell division protein PerM [Nocardioides sp. MAHUQ-72]|uniref:cell division protein PerM n=1 Tax=unclassified Nocardioides TaxID=2615069 RepID=UPI00361C9E21
MTSLLPRSTTRATGAADARDDLAHRRPLALIATLGGAVAAGSTLLVCMAVGVVGWFLTDAGAHGTPRGGLRVGALGWLLAHGSGVSVEGVPVTAVPLGLTLLCAWAVWRVGHRVGDSVSGHGPDADRIADGERDWTVASASLLFAVGYVAVALVTVATATDPLTGVSGARVVGWSLMICALLGGPAIAIGSGRAAIWASYLPLVVRGAAAACVRVLGAYAAVATLAFVAALVVDLGAAANVMSRLHTSGGDATMLVLLSLTVVPNAVAFSGSYLLGPGFAVGAHTIVSPSLVVLGPLPMFPLLAALPDDGPTPAWTVALVAVPVLVAALGAARAQRRLPTLRWDEGALRGCAGGVAAGVLFGLLAGLAGGAVGPGRMREVGPAGLDVLVHAVTAFGIGGLLGGLAMTWWQRRAARHAAETA